MASLKQIDSGQLPDNPFKIIGEDWMLVAAGGLGSYNMMTASWGGLGVLWNKRVAFCFVRHHRYTFEFIERARGFTLSFFEESQRPLLQLCGTKSGRDIDKMSVDGLTPVAGDTGNVYFEEARLVLECRTVYFQDIEPAGMLDDAVITQYPQRDYHRMYVGEVVNCLRNIST